MMNRKLLFGIGACFIAGIAAAIIVPIVLKSQKSDNDKDTTTVTQRSNSSITSVTTVSTTSRSTTRASSTTNRASTTANASSNRATYSSSLTSSSPFICYTGLCSGASYFIEPVQITVPTTGTYQLFTQSPSLDTFGLLYAPVFDIRFMLINLIAYDDDSNGNSQFLIQGTLQANQPYVVVVTTYNSNVTGAFTLVGTGPSLLTFTRQTNLRPISFANIYNVSSSLTTNSSRFCRNGTCANPTFYYQAFSFNVSASGYCIMTINSPFDSYGLFYNSTFNAANPRQGLVFGDDDSAGNGQFAVVLSLATAVRYTIVVTTYASNQIGAFILNIYCDASVSFG